MGDNKDFQERAQKIEALVDRVRDLPDENARHAALELLQAVMEFHRSVLERVLDLTSQAGTQGRNLLQQFGRDPMISGLLVLYDLHPEDLQTRVARALDKVRPLLRSHGGDVELVNLGSDVVHLRLMGSCHGCASSTATLKNAVEEAMNEAAPEIATIVADGTAQPQSQPAPGFVPLAKLESAA
jgi:Fe-S cluster biogenesis protein NfuA